MTAIIVLTVAAGLIYAAACASLPFARCRRCNGAGVRIARTRVLRRSVGKPCRWCRSSGKRLRWGRRAWNHFARIRSAGTR